MPFVTMTGKAQRLIHLPPFHIGFGPVIARGYRFICEVYSYRNALFCAQDFRQFAHHVVFACSRGELLKLSKQISGILAGQIRHIVAHGITVLAMTAEAELCSLLPLCIGLLASFRVSHNIFKLLQ